MGNYWSSGWIEGISRIYLQRKTGHHREKNNCSVGLIYLTFASKKTDQLHPEYVRNIFVFLIELNFQFKLKRSITIFESSSYIARLIFLIL